MTPAEYRTFLIKGILEMQDMEGFTEESLRMKPTHRLEVIYDTVGLPADEINWKEAGK